jgi:Putative restriction endonuclease
MVVLDCREPGLAEALIAARAANGHAYDYELGERYVMVPAPSVGHGRHAARISSALLLAGANVAAPANLGRIDGPAGSRWYVVPDVVVLEDDVVDAAATLRALVAVEVRSPREDRDRKLAEYREVMERTGLAVEEVWYLSDGAWTLHRAAGATPMALEESAFLVWAQAVQSVTRS